MLLGILDAQWKYLPSSIINLGECPLNVYFPVTSFPLPSPLLVFRALMTGHYNGGVRYQDCYFRVEHQPDNIYVNSKF